jgi:uncharacterized membrane protein YhiD involved in acid resistance
MVSAPPDHGIGVVGGAGVLAVVVVAVVLVVVVLVFVGPIDAIPVSKDTRPNQRQSALEASIMQHRREASTAIIRILTIRAWGGGRESAVYAMATDVSISCQLKVGGHTTVEQVAPFTCVGWV